MGDPDPFVTLPMRSQRTVEPSDFVAQLSDAVKLSRQAVDWFDGRSGGPRAPG